jgi:hypothetical protein
VSGIYFGASSFRTDVPKLCSEMTLTFRADSTMVSRNGDQLLTAHFAPQASDRGFLLTITEMRSNGRPNCQGLPADYVVGHQVARIYTEVSGDTLRYGDGPNQIVSTMIRIP